MKELAILLLSYIGGFMTITALIVYYKYKAVKADFAEYKAKSEYNVCKEQHQVRLLCEKVIEHKNNDIGEISLSIREFDDGYRTCVVEKATGTVYAATIDPMHDRPIDVINRALEIVEWAEREYHKEFTHAFDARTVCTTNK